MEALNDIGARVGDRIVLYYETGSFLKATFLLYLFPVLCLLAGAIGGFLTASRYRLDTSLMSAAGGFACLVLSFLIVRQKAQQMGKQSAYRPKIIKIR